MADESGGDEYRISYKIDFNLRTRICDDVFRNNKGCYGVLIGNVIHGLCYVVGCIKCSQSKITSGEKRIIDEKPDWIKEISEICTLLPTGLRICGMCIASQYQSDLELFSIKELRTLLTDSECEICIQDQLVWRLNPTTKDIEKTAHVFNLSTEIVKETNVLFEDICDEFTSKNLTFRLCHSFELTIEDRSNMNITMALSKKSTQFCNKLHNAIFYLPECQMFIEDDIVNKSPNDLHCILNVATQKCKQQSSKYKLGDVLNAEMVQPLSTTLTSNNHVPVICQFEKNNFVKFQFSLDILVMAAVNVSLSKLRKLFILGMKDQIQGLLSCIDIFSVDSSFCIPKVFHFETPQTLYLTTCIYPWKHHNGDLIEDNLFERERRCLLEKLFLPTHRPILHPNNMYKFENYLSASPYLVNPHESLNNPSGNGYVAIVHGRYSYHHYMQDNFDDNKWGCAYRSLQTIFSWFRHQGYTDKLVPDHRAIQQALVDIGDKPKSFIGSKKWIGSFEVNLCLDYFLDVSSKIMAVNNGGELASKGRELIRHFENEGTPIMIGGGVLAHTILGVSFNDKTGEIKFLILDPHYTGGENIKTIIDKGWCGWKNHLFWNQQAHYNLCLPQPPLKV